MPGAVVVPESVELVLELAARSSEGGEAINEAASPTGQECFRAARWLLACLRDAADFLYRRSEHLYLVDCGV